MTSRNITITSKNQITIPIDLVRKMKLGKNRQLQIRMRGDELVLKQEPPLTELMQPLWDDFHRTHPEFPALTDEDIHTESQQAYAEHFKQNPGKI
jgi:bifunctional DNA-binding transcriptional regulator/antitoxin component of YhaV-PrlF toxin-antitoxin module